MTVSDQVRTYGVSARQTDVFGRVVCSARDQHFVVDGPLQNGCPGEAVTPVEVFLSGVAACGVELLQVLARQSELPLSSVMRLRRESASYSKTCVMSAGVSVPEPSMSSTLRMRRLRPS